MTKLYLYSKKVHRVLVLVITAMILIMAGTGTMLEYSVSFFGLDLGLVRYVHNKLSIYFTVVLVLMMITGLYMYIFPVLNRHKKQETNQ
ncbi:MAG: hypothetical protein WC878_06570 [Candidatus Paceibacterota bacterium]|jgi:uncharacterized membrane protein